MIRPILAVVVLGSLVACDGDPREPIFPLDYRTTYREVRGCRFSIEHDFVRIRVLASPEAFDIYNDHGGPFPDGATLVKEELAMDDTRCEDAIVTLSVMKKLPPGTASDQLDWDWQEIDGATMKESSPTNIDKCAGCHTDCGIPPDGFEGTCTVP